MAWQTKVASWVIPLLADYAIPDDATVLTGVEFGTLDDATSPKILQGSTLQADYPGLVPDFSLDPEITPTTEGTQYNLKVKKAVGFYGIDCDVLSFNDKRLNKWTFPLLRRNFGYVALSRYSTVAADFPLHYENQYHFAEAIQALALNYDDDFSTNNLFNSVDKFCLTKVSVFLYPEVVLQVRFLPIWEVYAIRFFQNNQLSCPQKAMAMSGPPGFTDPNVPAGGYFDGYVIQINPPAPFPAWVLRCPGDYDDPVWYYEVFD
jgi:hypothetical protein